MSCELGDIEKLILKFHETIKSLDCFGEDRYCEDYEGTIQLKKQIGKDYDKILQELEKNSIIISNIQINGLKGR